MDTSDTWIRERTGIERRHYAAEGETTVDMGEHAARRAIAAAGLQPSDIDLIVFGTTTPDLVFPNAGAMLQNRLGCSGGPAFSVEAACSSFIYALSIADKFIRLGEAKRALVVGSETLSRITDFTDRTTAILFSDGAGALVLEASETAGRGIHPPACGWFLPEPAVLHRWHLQGLRTRNGQSPIDSHGRARSVQDRSEHAGQCRR